MFRQQPRRFLFLKKFNLILEVVEFVCFTSGSVACTRIQDFPPIAEFVDPPYGSKLNFRKLVNYFFQCCGAEIIYFRLRLRL